MTYSQGSMPPAAILDPHSNKFDAQSKQKLTACAGILYGFWGDKPEFFIRSIHETKYVHYYIIVHLLMLYDMYKQWWANQTIISDK